jgi:hypothetical protein
LFLSLADCDVEANWIRRENRRFAIRFISIAVNFEIAIVAFRDSVSIDTASEQMRHFF